MARRWAAFLAVVGLIAAALGLAGPAQADTRQQLKGATYNVYLGADLAPLALARTPEQLAALSRIAYGQVVATDFPSRARAISRLLKDERPEVIGLQEVALWKKGPLRGHLHTTYDFLDILLRELRSAGLHYRAAAVDTTGTITLPISAEERVSFTNRDVVLVQDGLPVTNAQSHLYAAKFSFTTPFGVTFTFPRGWSAVDVALKGKDKGKPARVRVATTHLQPGIVPVRDAQAQELHAALAQSPYPVTALGDFNALPFGTTGPYSTFTNGGYDDAWRTTNGAAGGFTAVQDPDLRNVPSKLSLRIDYVFYQPAHLSAVSAQLIGDKPEDRTAAGLWPSDHAGLVVRLRLQ